MKIKSFTYTKSSTEASHRDVLVVSEPSSYLNGIDISELSDEDQAKFAVEMSNQLDVHKLAQQTIMAKYDVRNRFRQFDPLKMTDVKDEYIA